MLPAATIPLAVAPRKKRLPMLSPAWTAVKMLLVGPRLLPIHISKPWPSLLHLFQYSPLSACADSLLISKIPPDKANGIGPTTIEPADVTVNLRPSVPPWVLVSNP